MIPSLGPSGFAVGLVTIDTSDLQAAQDQDAGAFTDMALTWEEHDERRDHSEVQR
jgi:hypothetical protein